MAAQPKDPFEKNKNTPKQFSYASMAAKPEPKPKVKSQTVWPVLPVGQRKSWNQVCDEDSSDEEDEDEEEDKQQVVEDNSAW